MSRKDYVEFARILREADFLTNEQRHRLAAEMASVFAIDNDRFQKLTFIQAAMLPEADEIP